MTPILRLATRRAASSTLASADTHGMPGGNCAANILILDQMMMSKMARGPKSRPLLAHLMMRRSQLGHCSFNCHFLQVAASTIAHLYAQCSRGTYVTGTCPPNGGCASQPPACTSSLRALMTGRTYR